MDTRSFQVLSLCSGVGQLDIGVKLAVPVARTVCYVEIESFPCEVLVSRMEEGNLDEAPIWTDLRTFNGKEWRGKVDCIIGGYPCQPFSVAGQMRGEDDPRHLWPSIKRIIEDVAPAWCFFENVRNHINIGLEQVRDDLQRLGYKVEAGIYSAEEVGAPHRRERLYIMANSISRTIQILETGKSNRKNGRTVTCTSNQLAYTNKNGCFNEHSTKRNSEKSQSFIECGESKLGNNNNTRLERWNVQGQQSPNQLSTWPPSPTDFSRWGSIIEQDKTVEPAVCRVVDGVDTRLDTSHFAYRKERLHAVGNGVVPLTAGFAFVSLLRRFQ